MRRKDRELTDIRKIEEIIAQARYMHLGMFDGDFPYVVPLHYGYEMSDGKLVFYIHCAKEGHKLDCIKENGNVFVQIDKDETLVTADIPCGYGATYKCVMCKGVATVVEDAKEKCNALMCLMKTQTGEEHKIDEQMADLVTVIKIEVKDYTAKVCEI